MQEEYFINRWRSHFGSVTISDSLVLWFHCRFQMENRKMMVSVWNFWTVYKRTLSSCHTFTMSKQQCMTQIIQWIAPWFTITDQVILLSLPLKKTVVLSHILTYHKLFSFSFFFFFFLGHTVHVFSLSKSTSHDVFDVVFPCHDGVMVCSQAAVLWWQASLSMKSFLLTSRCMLVKERLAPQIMEGLTIHLNGHLEINAHLLAAVFFFF